MAIAVDKLELEQLTAENKALHKKQLEILARKAEISAEVGKRMLARKASGSIMGMSEKELDAVVAAAEAQKAKLKAQAAKEAKK